jgi:hypothetical protein
MATFALLLLAFAALPGPSVWKGTIGPTPVVLRLDGSESAYAFSHLGKSISLVQTSNTSSSMTFTEGGGGELTLKVSRKQLKGRFRANGEELPVSLVRLPMKGGLRETYDLERAAALLEATADALPATNTGDTEVRWTSSPGAPKGWPRFPGLDAVNAELEKRQTRDVANFLDCEDPARSFTYATTIDVTGVGADWVSLRVRTLRHCGTPPERSEQGLILDKKRAAAIDLTKRLDVFQGLPEAGEYTSAFKRLLSQVGQLSSQCYGSGVGGLSRAPSWAIEGDFVWVSTDNFPQAVKECDTAAKVPRALLEKLLKKGQSLPAP